MRTDTKISLLISILLLLPIVAIITLLVLSNSSSAISLLGMELPRIATKEEVSTFPMPDQVIKAWEDITRIGYTSYNYAPGKSITNVNYTFIRHPSLDTHGYVLLIEDLQSGDNANLVNDLHSKSTITSNMSSPVSPYHFGIGLGLPYRLKNGAICPSLVGNLIEIKGDSAKRFLKSGPTTEEIDMLLRGVGLPTPP